MHKRPLTEPQAAALVKARAALQRKHTCERCGDDDPSCGLQKHSDARIYARVEDGVPRLTFPAHKHGGIPGKLQGRCMSQTPTRPVSFPLGHRRGRLVHL